MYEKSYTELVAMAYGALAPRGAADAVYSVPPACPECKGWGQGDRAGLSCTRCHGWGYVRSPRLALVRVSAEPVPRIPDEREARALGHAFCDGWYAAQQPMRRAFDSMFKRNARTWEFGPDTPYTLIRDYLEDEHEVPHLIACRVALWLTTPLRPLTLSAA